MSKKLPTSQDAGGPGRLRKVAWIALSIMVLIAIGLAALLVYRRSHPKDAYQHYVRGVRSLDKKDFPSAFKMFSEAVRLEGTNTMYLQAAARAAGAIGANEQAQRYALLAWDNGVKTPEQLRLILRGFDRLDRTNGLSRALQLVSQLPVGPERSELRGDVLLYFGRTNEAIEVWRELLRGSPTSELAVKTAEALLASKQNEKAVSLLEEQLSKGQLQENGVVVLATIYSLDDRRYTNSVRVFEEARRQGHYANPLKLAHGLTLLVNHRNKDGKAILELLKKPAAGEAPSPLQVTARMFLGTLLLSEQDSKGINELLAVSRDTPSGVLKEGEGLFYESLLLILEKKDGALERLDKAHRLMPEQPAVALVFARESSKAGKYADAIAACRAVQGPLAKWPSLMFELASALHRDGKDPEALKVLDQLHSRGFASKESLMLARDAAYGSNQPQRGQSTQAFLERQFPNDADVRFFRGFAALRAGQYPTAKQIFEELSGKFPEDVRYKLAEVQVSIARSDARSALDQLKKLNAKPELLSPLIGIAHARLQEWNEAAAAFKEATQSPQPAAVLIEYGMVLLQLNQPAEAARQFEQAFAKDPRQTDARLGLALAAYSQGDLESARKQAALLLNNPELDASRLLFLASSELRYAQYPQALEYCRLALAKDTNSADARMIRGTALGLTGQYGPAEQDLAWAARKKPENLAIRKELASVYVRSGQYDKASAIIDQILAASPKDLDVQLLKFETLARSSQFAPAQAYLDGLKGALFPPQYFLCASWLADLRGQREEASALLLPHLTNSAVAIQWGRLQFNTDEAAAMRAIQRLRGLKLNAAQWAGFATLAEQKRMTNAAVDCYQEALNLTPDDPLLLNNWAWASVQLPRFDEAKVVAGARKAYEALRRNSSVIDTYAEVLLRTRRFEECINLLEANQTIVNQAPQLLWLQGLAYQATNQKQKAVAAYERCQDLVRKKTPGLRADAAELPKRISQLRASR